MASDELEGPIWIRPVRPTHTIVLTLRLPGPDQWALVWSRLNRLLNENFEGVQSFSLSSYDMAVWDDDEAEETGEYHDENTLFTVFQALRRHMSESQATLAIHDMQNAGILFRQRR